MLSAAKLIQRLTLRVEWMSGEHWWNDTERGKRSNQISSGGTLSVINPKWTEFVVLDLRHGAFCTCHTPLFLLSLLHTHTRISCISDAKQSQKLTS